jgi:hypothetical protein
MSMTIVFIHSLPHGAVFIIKILQQAHNVCCETESCEKAPCERGGGRFNEKQYRYIYICVCCSILNQNRAQNKDLKFYVVKFCRYHSLGSKS